MNGFQPNANNFVGALGEYPIYDYLQDNYISTTTLGNLIYKQDPDTIVKSGNEIKFLTNSITDQTKIANNGTIQVYHNYDALLPLRLAGWWSIHDELSSCQKTDIAMRVDITTAQGAIITNTTAITTNTTAIATNTGAITTLTTGLATNVTATGTNTAAIAGLVTAVAGKANATSFQNGASVIYLDLIGNCQLGYNSTCFGQTTNGGHQDLTLTDAYKNLPTTITGLLPLAGGTMTGDLLSTSGKKIGSAGCLLYGDRTNITNLPAGGSSQWVNVPSTSTDLKYMAGKIGIGTATPASTLDVVGNINYVGNISGTGTTNITGLNTSKTPASSASVLAITSGITLPTQTPVSGSTTAVYYSFTHQGALNGAASYSYTEYNLILTVNTIIQLLMVAGGGGGGSVNGSGGGAGGLVYISSAANYTLVAGTYKIRVGAGGLGMQTTGDTTTYN